jgi:putative oxidoreductase
LIVVPVVATAAVHWPADWSTLSELAQGDAITNKGHGNFKLLLIDLAVMLLLLLLLLSVAGVATSVEMLSWQASLPTHLCRQEPP